MHILFSFPFQANGYWKSYRLRKVVSHILFSGTDINSRMEQHTHTQKLNSYKLNY